VGRAARAGVASRPTTWARTTAGSPTARDHAGSGAGVGLQMRGWVGK
jgi:hypothetical protein